MSIESLTKRLAAASDRFKYLSGAKSSREKKLESTRLLAVEKRDEASNYEKSHQVLALMMKRMSTEEIGSMDRLVNFGLKTVFVDREIKMKTEVDDTGKRMLIKMNTYSGSNQSLMDDHGSVSVIQSLLLRVLCIMKLKLPRVILLDETLAAVDSVYINNAANLLTELSTRLDFDIGLVTHNPGAVEANVYRAVLNSSNELSLVKEGHIAPSIQH